MTTACVLRSPRAPSLLWQGPYPGFLPGIPSDSWEIDTVDAGIPSTPAARLFPRLRNIPRLYAPGAPPPAEPLVEAESRKPTAGSRPPGAFAAFRTRAPPLRDRARARRFR